MGQRNPSLKRCLLRDQPSCYPSFPVHPRARHRPAQESGKPSPGPPLKATTAFPVQGGIFDPAEVRTLGSTIHLLYRSAEHCGLSTATPLSSCLCVWFLISKPEIGGGSLACTFVVGEGDALFSKNEKSGTGEGETNRIEPRNDKL